MGEKQGGKGTQVEAVQVFRQFAWNIAGTLGRKPARKGAVGPRGRR